MTHAPQTTANNRDGKTLCLRSRPILNPSRLCIFNAISEGVPIQMIKRDLSVSDGTFQYHLSILKKQGFIRKVGYGTWEPIVSLDSGEETTAMAPQVGQRRIPVLCKQPRGEPREVCDTAAFVQSSLHEFVPDAVRAHAFMFRLEVPAGLRNWNNERRAQFLDKRKISFVQLGIAGGGQRIVVCGRKVWLTNSSIIIYDRASYFAEDALLAKSTALASHIRIVRKVERLLHVSFEIGGDYKFRVSRQHYALIQNALAKQFNEDGVKLEVRNGSGLWFLIDNSFNLNEAEAVHSSSAMSDSLKVQDWFNGLKESPITPGFLLEMMHGIQSNQAVFAENMVSHVDAVRALGCGVDALTVLLGRLKED